MENVVTLWGENGPKFVQHHAPTYVWVVFCLAPRPPAAQQLDIGDNNCFTLGDNEYG